MVGPEALRIAVLELLVLPFGLQSVESELDAPGVVALAVHRLQRGVGDEGVGRTVLALLIDADDTEGEGPHPDVGPHQPPPIGGGCCARCFSAGSLPQWGEVGGGQLLRLIITEDDNLALPAHVDLVDEAAMEHLRLLNLEVVGIDAHQRGGEILLPVGDGLSILREDGPDVVDGLGKVRAGGGDVAVLQRQVAALLQPLIGLRGHSAEHHHRVRQEAVRLLHLGVDQSVSGAQQDDEHEDAPGHGKSRQARAQLVAARRLPYLIQ